MDGGRYRPRLDFENPVFLESSIKSREERRDEYAGNPSHCLFNTHKDLGLYCYAAGYPLARTREEFALAGEGFERLCGLRATEPPRTITTWTSGQPPVVTIHPPDHSSTNSKEGLTAAYLALIAGRDDLARRLAALIWDPPDADYIGPRSEVCPTNEDQRLAFGFREFFADDPTGAERELAKIRRVEGRLAFQKQMIRTLMAGERFEFSRALHKLTALHDVEARRPVYADAICSIYESDDFLCLPGLALSTLALRRGLLDKSWLPEDDLFFPIELIHDGDRPSSM